jgi:hypothetical protein
MKGSKSRMRLTLFGPFYEFDDKAIDLTKKGGKPKRTTSKRKGPKKR